MKLKLILTHCFPSGLRSALEHDPRRRGGDRDDRRDRRRDVRGGLPDDEAQHPDAVRARRRRHPRLAADEKHQRLKRKSPVRFRVLVIIFGFK